MTPLALDDTSREIGSGFASGGGSRPGPAMEPVEFFLSDEMVERAAPGGARAESIGALRTHLITQHLAAGRRSLALCSPTPGIGCTALAVNIAMALAEAGTKTLLIDADMREPAIHQHVIPSREVTGLQQGLLDERIGFGDMIQPNVLPNLSLCYAGGRAERPQELLAAPRFKRFVDLCVREYDIVIADTPPANESADARLIATVLSYALLVAGRDRSFVADVNLLAQELAADQTTIIGSVLSLG